MRLGFSKLSPLKMLYEISTQLAHNLNSNDDAINFHVYCCKTIEYTNQEACVKHSDVGRAVQACAHVIQKRPWCAIVEACVVNRVNMVIAILTYINIVLCIVKGRLKQFTDMIG